MPTVRGFLSAAALGSHLAATDELAAAGQFLVNEAKKIGEFLETQYASIEGLDSHYLARVFEDTYSFTALKAWKWFPPQDGKSDGTIYTSTGDIPQMWLRDSSAQMLPYVHSAANPEGEAVRNILEAAMKRQILFILDDRYGSAFFDSHGEGDGQGPSKNECPPSATCKTCQCDRCAPECGLYTYQKDFELDSLFYVLLLHFRYWKATGRTQHLDDNFSKALLSILDLLKIEQYHKTKSKYFYKDLEGDFREGVGLIWTFALPSDDQATGYNIPQNLMGTVVLKQTSEIAREVLKNDALAEDLVDLARQVEAAIADLGIVSDKSGAKVFAYTVNGYKGDKARFTLMDDANMPNLLWLPYLGYADHADIYKQTRREILSKDDENWFEGTFEGLGSQHHSFGLRPVHPGAACNGNCIWPLGLIMQGMTATDPLEKIRVMKTILSTTSGQTVLHEGFSPSDPSQYNRDLFGWANALFSEWVFRQWASPKLRGHNATNGVWERLTKLPEKERKGVLREKGEEKKKEASKVEMDSTIGGEQEEDANVVGEKEDRAFYSFLDLGTPDPEHSHHGKHNHHNHHGDSRPGSQLLGSQPLRRASLNHNLNLNSMTKSKSDSKSKLN